MNMFNPFFNHATIAGLALVLSVSVQAAPREANKNDAAVLKLQGMVKSLTAERDAAKAEADKMKAEITQLQQEKAAALAGKEALGSELSAQKAAQQDARNRLEQTNTRLLESLDKHKQVSQARQELNTQLEQLKVKQQTTEQQLGVCEDHNLKLYQSANELLDRYQNKGVLSNLLQDEPILQFQSVEMESIVQEYQDKLSAGQFKQEAKVN
jgi:chromosome segregation ATPase